VGDLVGERVGGGGVGDGVGYAVTVYKLLEYHAILLSDDEHEITSISPSPSISAVMTCLAPIAFVLIKRADEIKPFP